MPVIGSALIFPIIPFLVWKIRHKETMCSKAEFVVRYLTYFLFMIFLLSMALGVAGSDEASFWRKINDSLEFRLKVLFLGLGAVLLAAGIEWLYERLCVAGRKAALNAFWEKTVGGKGGVFLQKYIFPVFLFLLAAAVIFLNVRLMFDNVLWGDEAFSANTAQKSIGGILQVLYFWDNHPPLHYYWLKLIGELFGYTVPVFHLASLIPFIIGILLAVTLFCKRFGRIPAASFVVISGLGAACLEYNLEVRMYSLAFLCVLAAFYCSYRVIGTGKRSAWTGLLLWTLAAAYTHYYAMVAGGFLLFFTGAAVWIKYRGNTWRKGVMIILLFLAGYAPWLVFLFVAIKNVSGSWWMTEILGLDVVLDIIMGSEGMSKIVFPLLLIILLICLSAESGLFTVREQHGHRLLSISAPTVKKWSDEMYAMIVGGCTIIATLAFAYLLCVIIAPLLAQRYMYPLSAVAIAMLMLGSSHVLTLLRQLGRKIQFCLLEPLGKIVLAAVILILAGKGMVNYQNFDALAEEQRVKTDAVLELIGKPDPDVKMVTNGVKHLGWTVLYFYYPDNEIVNGSYDEAEADRYWYFSPGEIGEDERALLNGRGFSVTDYGEKQISQYPFFLYYIDRTNENIN